MRCAHNVRAAHFSAVAIAPDERWRFDLSTRDEAGHGIDRRTVVPRHHDRFAPIREDVPPRILRLVLGTIERLELQTLRPEAPQAGLFHADQSPRRLDVRVDVQPLRHPKLATWTPQK